MKKLLLEEILLLSQKEKSAKRIDFDPKRTIILGNNKTGKSCLIKSIYQTFGAESPKIPEPWKKTDATSMVRFRIDENKYSILRHGSIYAIFDGDSNLIKAFKSLSKELAPYYADLFDFKIKLQDKKKDLVTPPPSYLFLPFYIDQDLGWANNWSSFDRLYIPNGKNALVNYHTGIRPNEWYEAKGDIEQIKDEIKVYDDERKMLRNIRDNLRQELAVIPFSIDIDAFKKEIASLMQECIELNALQEKLKGKLVEYHNLRIILQTQINITEKAMKEAQKDYHYTIEPPQNNYVYDDHVECPTCGAEYENTFAQQFSLAQDEGECFGLLLQLKNKLLDVEEKIRVENSKYSNNMEQVTRANALLEKKREEVTLNDLIESKGKNKLHEILQSRIEGVSQSIFEKNERLEKAKDKLKRYEDRKKADEIIGKYKDLMRRFVYELDASEISEKVYDNIAAKISASGSTNPRAILAYFFSILHIIKDYTSSSFCPILIDTPNQQGQDEINLPKVLQFISDYQPENSQLILALEKTEGVSFGGKIVELKTKHSLLHEDEYDSVFSELQPFIEKAIVGDTSYSGGLFQ